MTKSPRTFQLRYEDGTLYKQGKLYTIIGARRVMRSHNDWILYCHLPERDAYKAGQSLDPARVTAAIYAIGCFQFMSYAYVVI
jgi:hypothetical protein